MSVKLKLNENNNKYIKLIESKKHLGFTQIAYEWESNFFYANFLIEVTQGLFWWVFLDPFTQAGLSAIRCF